MEHSNAVGAIAFAPDGRTLASGSWKSGRSQVCEIKLWDVNGGPVLKTLQGGRKVKWDGKGPQPPFFGNWGQVNALAFSPNGRLLASGGVGGRATLWDAWTGDGYATEPVKETGRPDPPLMSLSFLTNRQLVGVRSDWKLLIWSIQNHRLVQRVLPLRGSGRLLCSSFSRDGSLVATGSDDGWVRVWMVPSGELAFQTRNAPLDEQGIPQQVTAVALAPDGQSLVSANYSHIYWNEIQIISSKRLSLTGQGIMSLTYSPDGRTVAAAGDKDILLFDVSNVKAQQRYYLYREGRKLAVASAPVRLLAFSPTERILAGGAKTDANNNGAVVVWK